MAKKKEFKIGFKPTIGLPLILESENINLLISTYQNNCLFTVSAKNKKLSVDFSKFERPMGLFTKDNSFYLGGKYQIWRFNNVVPTGSFHEQNSHIFIPHVSWTTADVDSHDIVVEDDGRLVFVNTLYSCLCTTTEESNFIPIWKPPIVDELTPEDRCHLNGLCLRDGKIRYVSAFSKTNVKRGWSSGKGSGGVIWDIKTNEAVIDDLNMPHSPRWHKDELWILESGTGKVCKVNLKNKSLTEVIKLPGYLRGLVFYKHLAFIGSSLPRKSNASYSDELLKRLESNGTDVRCGIFVIDTRNGDLVQSIQIEGGIDEIYDVAILEKCSQAKVINLDDENIRFLVNFGKSASNF